MLLDLKRIIGRKVHATDGDLGHVHAFFFDDDQWTVRYFVVETGNWLFGRKVLLSPTTLQRVGWESNEIRVYLTREQVRTSPDVDSDKPLSRQHETDLANHYAWPVYWGGGIGAPLGSPSLLFGTNPMPVIMRDAQTTMADDPEACDKPNPHLRSSEVVIGYRIRAKDGEIGHLDDLVADDEDWTIRMVIADTGAWLPGRKVAILPSDITWSDYSSPEISADYSREMIKGCPEFHPKNGIPAEFEAELRRYYGKVHATV